VHLTISLWLIHKQTQLAQQQKQTKQDVTNPCAHTYACHLSHGQPVDAGYVDVMNLRDVQKTNVANHIDSTTTNWPVQKQTLETPQHMDNNRWLSMTGCGGRGWEELTQFSAIPFHKRPQHLLEKKIKNEINLLSLLRPLWIWAKR